MNAKERFEKYLSYRSLSKVDIEKKARLGKGSLSKKTGFNSDTLEKIAELFPELNLNWLLTGRGNKESDNCIYHFTNEYNGFINIFRKKIKPQFSIEDLTFLPTIIGNITLDIPPEEAFPIFCLCDIPYERVGNHMKKFGNYGIGFKKEWGIKNEINPVHYFHHKKDAANAISVLINFIKVMEEQKEFLEKSGLIKDFSIAKNYLSYLLSISKHYEKNGVRYYDEKEWRYYPLKEFIVNNIQSVLAPIKNDIGNYEEIKKEYCSNHQDLINKNNNIKLDFLIDDIEYIIIDNKEKNKFLNDIKDFYNEEEIKRISLVIDKNNYNSFFIEENKETIQSEDEYNKDELIKLLYENRQLRITITDLEKRDALHNSDATDASTVTGT